MLSHVTTLPTAVVPTSPADSTRDAILDAALSLFSTKGFASSTTREIAARAGVAEVTLFRHFSSKENLFEELLMSRSFVTGLDRLVEELDDRPYRDALEILCRRLMNALVTYRDWIVMLHGEIRRFPDLLVPRYHRFLDTLFGELSRFFASRQARGELRAGFDPDMAARALHGMVFCLFNVEELLLRKVYRPVDQESAMRAFVDLLYEGTILK